MASPTSRVASGTVSGRASRPAIPASRDPTSSTTARSARFQRSNLSCDPANVISSAIHE